MDATSGDRDCRLLVFVLSFVGLTGCSQGGGQVQTTSAPACSSRASQTSFLVQWKDKVPQEYEAYKLTSDSLTTKFDHVDKATVEKEVLQRHLGEYTVAEHDFVVDTLTPQASPTPTPSPDLDWGQTDIQLNEAWTLIPQQGEGIVVAVVDSGADINHPLLKSQIWTNPGEIPGNGVDDDRNGLVDDFNGWNFLANNNSLTDNAEHGTHVAGIIAGQSHLASHFSGVAPKAKLMILKFLDDGGTIGHAIKAMNYATAHGAKVINASWGGSQCSDILKQEIIKATQNGVIFVVASGNTGQDLSRIAEWPAVYQIAGKITVGAYKATQVLSTFSNYGTLVDLAAPGEAILSAVPENATTPPGTLRFKSGTSMATPFVSGIAALLLSARPDASPNQITDTINQSVVAGKFGVRTGGKLNALGASKLLLGLE